MRNSKALWLIPLCLTGCLAQGSYHNQNTVHFSHSGNSISETNSGSYSHMGLPPVSGSLAVQGSQGAVLIHSPAPPPVYIYDYPQDSRRVYSDGNTTISRGTIYLGDCTQNIRRHGRIYSRRIPCPY